MKFNSLAEALALAEKEKPFAAVPASPPAPPKPQPPPIPSYPPLKKVEGGVIKRTPIDRKTALVVAKAAWWAVAPFTPDPKSKELPVVEAQLKRAVEWIKKLEQINLKLREQLKTNKEESAEQLAKLSRKIDDLMKQKSNLEAQNAALVHKASIADLWEKR